MSRDLFNIGLVQFPASCDIEFGFLLLSVCTTARRALTGPFSLDQNNLYLAAKQILAPLQMCTTGSVNFIKSVIVLAVYEYTIQAADVALTTLSIAIRMAYNIELDRNSLVKRCESTSSLEERELNNVWWMLVICER